MSSINLPTHKEVIAICEANGPHANGVSYSSDLWIKYGIDVTVAEAALQQHIHDHADHDTLYTPPVYECFTDQQPGAQRMTYIVQEKCVSISFAEYKKRFPQHAKTMYSKVCDAVRHLWSLDPPSSSLGPLQGQMPAGRLFSDYGAGRTFRNIAELETWINTSLGKAGQPKRVDLSRQELRIRHCNLSQFNIHIDMLTDRIIFLDWGFSGNYPIALEEYALVHQFNLPGMNFAKNLHKELFGSGLSAEMQPLCRFVRINAFGEA